ncbi:MAG: alpha/beta hydrolase fold domain-containing protein [Planctomycetota bacterium]
MNYRLSPRAKFPAYLEDAAASLAWVRREVKKNDGDPGLIFVSGHSAGGYITAMLGMNPKFLAHHGLGTEAIAGLLPIAGQMVTHSTVRGERGISRHTPIIDAAAPSFHVRKYAPPILSICGGKDLPARAAENIYFVDALRASGHRDVEYLEVPERTHTTIASWIGKDGDAVFAAMREFIEKRSREAFPKPKPAHAGHRILASDSSRKRIAIIAPDGTLEWEYKVGPLHDLHRLANGNLLFQTNWTRIVEVEPKSKRVVWEYDASFENGNQGKRVECHAFGRLKNGLTFIAESGPGRIIEVDREKKIRHSIKLKVARPNPHRDTRLVRALGSGNYLVSHEGMGLVREYDRSGAIVWEYAVPLFRRAKKRGHGLHAFGNATFCAIRLKNGNTLISTGNGHSVLEVAPSKRIVWALHQNELEGVRLAWVTTLEELPNGNLIIGNCHAGPENPQILEVTRSKKVVWSYKNFELFGNALSNSVVLRDSN